MSVRSSDEDWMSARKRRILAAIQLRPNHDSMMFSRDGRVFVPEMRHASAEVVSALKSADHGNVNADADMTTHTGAIVANSTQADADSGQSPDTQKEAHGGDDVAADKPEASSRDSTNAGREHNGLAAVVDAEIPTRSSGASYGAGEQGHDADSIPIKYESPRLHQIGPGQPTTTLNLHNNPLRQPPPPHTSSFDLPINPFVPLAIRPRQSLDKQQGRILGDFSEHQLPSPTTPPTCALEEDSDFSEYDSGSSEYDNTVQMPYDNTVQMPYGNTISMPYDNTISMPYDMGEVIAEGTEVTISGPTPEYVLPEYKFKLNSSNNNSAMPSETPGQAATSSTNPASSGQTSMGPPLMPAGGGNEDPTAGWPKNCFNSMEAYLNHRTWDEAERLYLQGVEAGIGYGIVALRNQLADGYNSAGLVMGVKATFPDVVAGETLPVPELWRTCSEGFELSAAETAARNFMKARAGVKGTFLQFAAAQRDDVVRTEHGDYVLRYNPNDRYNPFLGPSQLRAQQREEARLAAEWEKAQEQQNLRWRLQERGQELQTRHWKPAAGGSDNFTAPSPAVPMGNGVNLPGPQPQQRATPGPVNIPGAQPQQRATPAPARQLSSGSSAREEEEEESTPKNFLPISTGTAAAFLRYQNEQARKRRAGGDANTRSTRGGVKSRRGTPGRAASARASSAANTPVADTSRANTPSSRPVRAAATRAAKNITDSKQQLLVTLPIPSGAKGAAQFAPKSSQSDVDMADDDDENEESGSEWDGDTV